MKNKTIHLLVKTLLTVLVIGTPAACTYSAYHGLPITHPVALITVIPIGILIFGVFASLLYSVLSDIWDF